MSAHVCIFKANMSTDLHILSFFSVFTCVFKSARFCGVAGLYCVPPSGLNPLKAPLQVPVPALYLVAAAFIEQLGDAGGRPSCWDVVRCQLLLAAMQRRGGLS